MLDRVNHYLRRWQKVQLDLGVEICLDVTLRLTEHVELHVPVLVPRFGAEKGMIVVPEYRLIEDKIAKLSEGGYGYSVIDYPEERDVYRVQDYVELFSDWGWSGDPKDTPEWLKDGC